MNVDAEGHRIAKERAESGDWASPIRWRPQYSVRVAEKVAEGPQGELKQWP